MQNSILKGSSFVFLKPNKKTHNKLDNFINPPENSLVINILINDLNFYRFRSFEKLCYSLLERISKEKRLPIIKRYEKYIGSTFSDLFGKKRTKSSSVGESIVSAVVRRISRESHHYALFIDKAARFMIELVNELSSSKYLQMYIVLNDFNNWDRPSLRIVNRFNVLNESYPVTWIALDNEIEDNLFTNNPMLYKRLQYVRRQFFSQFLRIQPKVTDGLYNPQGQANVVVKYPIKKLSLEKKFLRDSMRNAAEELAFQNYERVYVILEPLFRNLIDNELQAQVYRLVALTDASRGDYSLAYKLLSKAYRTTKLETYKAHIKYLQGLIHTKRYYDLKAAGQDYEMGMNHLGKATHKNHQFLLEKAWLLNGQALVHSLRAKSLSKKAASRELEKGLSLEIQAFNIAKGKRGPDFAYLRYNLLANITFLLEITKQYDKAIEFWTKSFEQYLISKDPSFEIAYYTRLGLLEFKEGLVKNSIEKLKKALKSSVSIQDPFYEERVLYAIAFIQLHEKQFSESLFYFKKGLTITKDLREMSSFYMHLHGVLWNAAYLNDNKLFWDIIDFGLKFLVDEHHKTLLNSLKKNIKDKNLINILKNNDMELPLPSPKLPSYIPSIDLEGTPSQDINRYLLSENKKSLS